jgi:hypothetical protein
MSAASEACTEGTEWLDRFEAISLEGSALTAPPIVRALVVALLEAESHSLKLRAFAQEILEDWPETNEFEGLQECAAKHGLLAAVSAEGPCGAGCSCEEYEARFPVKCWRKTKLLLGGPQG